MTITYEIRCDREQHCVLLVEEKQKFSYFVARDKRKVELQKLPTAAFNKRYCLVYEDYPLQHFATRMLNSQTLGIIVTPRAKAHLHNLFKEPIMAKFSKVASEPEAAPAPTKEAKTKKTAEVKSAVPANVKPEPAEGEEVKVRVRRDKLPLDGVIKQLSDNPARTGTIRHSIVDTIFQAKTVAMALDSSVERKDGSEYKIGLPDLYFALDNGLIEIK